jgi:hypothetical protein
MKTLSMVLAVLLCSYVIFIVSLVEKPTHWDTKNCELSEISPDFTPQDKADCRIMRSKK